MEFVIMRDNISCANDNLYFDTHNNSCKANVPVVFLLQNTLFIIIKGTPFKEQTSLKVILVLFTSVLVKHTKQSVPEHAIKEAFMP